MFLMDTQCVPTVHVYNQIESQLYINIIYIHILHSSKAGSPTSEVHQQRKTCLSIALWPTLSIAPRVWFGAFCKTDWTLCVPHSTIGMRKSASIIIFTAWRPGDVIVVFARRMCVGYSSSRWMCVYIFPNERPKKVTGVDKRKWQIMFA